MTLYKECLRVSPVAVFLAALIPFAVTPVLPIIDFYNHLARFFVLAHIGTSPLLQRYYQANWTLLPDMGVDVLATPLLVILPPLFAAKIIASGIFALVFSGVLYFHRAQTKTQSALIAVFLAPLLYSYVFNWGFENFLLGLGIAFWAAGWWVRHRDRPLLAVPVSCIFSLAIFFSHGVAFLFYGVLVGCWEIGTYIAAPDSKLNTIVRPLSLVAIQAILPVTYFILWKDGYAGGAAVTTLHLAPIPFSTRIVPAVLYHLKTIVRMEEGPALWFDVATLAIQIAAIAALFWQGKLSFEKSARFLAWTVVLLAAMPLPTLFGVGYIADRIPLFTALTLIGSLRVSPGRWTKAGYVLATILVATTFLRITAIAISWHPYAQDYSEFETIATKIPPGSLTTEISIGAGHHETDVPRCEMYGPLLIALFGQVGPLFADEKQQPLRMIGQLKPRTASTAADLNHPDLNYNDQMVRILSSGYDYLLICNLQLLGAPIPKSLQIVASSPHFALLRYRPMGRRPES